MSTTTDFSLIFDATAEIVNVLKNYDHEVAMQALATVCTGYGADGGNAMNASGTRNGNGGGANNKGGKGKNADQKRKDKSKDQSKSNGKQKGKEKQKKENKKPKEGSSSSHSGSVREPLRAHERTLTAKEILQHFEDVGLPKASRQIGASLPSNPKRFRMTIKDKLKAITDTVDLSNGPWKSFRLFNQIQQVKLALGSGRDYGINAEDLFRGHKVCGYLTDPVVTDLLIFYRSIKDEKVTKPEGGTHDRISDLGFISNVDQHFAPPSSNEDKGAGW